MFSVLIRPLQEEDFRVSVKWRNDPDVWKYTGKRPDRYITEEIEHKWITKVLSESNSYRFAILADEIYIGNIQLTGIKAGEEAEYHIFIGEKNYWGKGIAKLASLQIIRFAKEQLGLKQIYLKVNSENIPAIKVYENLGFVRVSDEIKMVYNLAKEIIPKVSVFMMTYNHEPFIGQAIESILCQKTSFDFDLVIGEDFSTDNTREIIKSIACEYPGKFKLILHDRNIGPHANQFSVFNACQGDYIAMCEGDDYWTDPLKLQKQVAFLEANLEYTFAFHDAMILNQRTGEKHIRIGTIKIDEIVDLKSVILQKNIPTASLVFRNMLDYKSLPDWFSKIIKGDYGLCVLLAEKGLGKYFPGAMSVYRVHDGGTWSGKNYESVHRADTEFYWHLLEYFTEKKIRHAIKAKMQYVNFNYGINKIRNGHLLSGLFLAGLNLRLTGDHRLRTRPRKMASAIKTWLQNQYSSESK